MRLLFAGTPDVAVPALEALTASRHELVGVLTRPDAPSGRGRALARSPVARWAHAHDLPVLQPLRLSEPAALQAIRDLEPDCCPVVAYGNLVPPAALQIPRHGWVNLHFSVLPAWRGAAPVQHALIAGDEVTGASTFALEQGLDTGPVYGVLTERVRATDTAGDLLCRLADAGAGLLVATLDGVEDGTLQARPQPADGVSLAPKLTVEDARIDWTEPPLAVDRRIRACTPDPGAWTTWRGERLGLGPVRRCTPGSGDGGAVRPDLAPGQLQVAKRFVAVGVRGSGQAPTAVLLGEVRPPGRRAMPAADWARGVRPEPGERFG